MRHDDRLKPGVNIELDGEISDVGAHRGRADVQVVGHARRVLSLREKQQYLRFSVSKFVLGRGVDL